MNPEELAERIRVHISRIPALRLDPIRTTAQQLLNWGGFVNQCFTISDGSHRYHLKLTNKKHRVMRLRRWLQLHLHLEQRYRAPRLIDWIDLSEIGFEGLLFEHVDGRPADFYQEPNLLKEVIEFAHSLHRDGPLGAALGASDSAKTYLDYFIETYIDRFSADLETIQTDRPAFISSELFQWMSDETLRLQEQAGATEAFDFSAIEPVHGDLHEGNLIVTSSGWFITDWDDLALGDPALE